MHGTFNTGLLLLALLSLPRESTRNDIYAQHESSPSTEEETAADTGERPKVTFTFLTAGEMREGGDMLYLAGFNESGRLTFAVHADGGCDVWPTDLPKSKPIRETSKLCKALYNCLEKTYAPQK